MRLTLALWKQHIGRMIRKHWYIQGKRVIRKTDAEETISKMGIPIADMNDVIKSMKVIENVIEDESHKPINLSKPLPAFNESHPLYKERHCYMYKDNMVILKGLDQAKNVAKAVQVKDGLPKSIEDKITHLNISYMDKLVKRSILASHVFDSQQVKLPKLHDPSRPAWNFPREYGISEQRSNYLLCEKLVQLCNTSKLKNSSLFTVNNSKCVVPLLNNGDLIQFDLTLNLSLLSSVPHDKFSSPEEDELAKRIDIPDIYPLKPTVTFQKTHFYDPLNIFPVSDASKFCNLHTIIIHHNKTEVKNLYETPVKDSQLLGRCLLYSFATAVSQARQLFTDTEGELPFPISVQCIQTDGRIFDFLVFQLNTLNINNSEGQKNIFWLQPRMELFEKCAYIEGKPTLVGYNNEVFKHFIAFCTNH